MRLLCTSIALTLTVFIAGCGVVGDGVNMARSINFSPGDLYQPEFYMTATPEEVKAAIGWGSLKNESHTERSYSKPSGGFMSELATVWGIFLPISDVHSKEIFPLPVAAQYTPYPEVITLMLEAGAEDPMWEALRNAVKYQMNNDVTKILLAHAFAKFGGVGWSPLEWALRQYVERGDREMEDFCRNLLYPGVDINVGHKNEEKHYKKP